MLAKIDEFILDQFNRFSDVTYRLCGMSAATWERLFVIFSVIFLVHFWTAQLIDNLMSSLIIFFRLSQFFFTFEERNPGALRNIHRITEQNTRIIYIFLCVLFSPAYFHGVPLNFWFECVAVSMYFRACDTLPPSESRKYLKFKQLLKLQPVGA